MIGETLEDNDDILGAVVSIKRGQDRLSVWTKTASDEVRALSICSVYIAEHHSILSPTRSLTPDPCPFPSSLHNPNQPNRSCSSASRSA